MKSLVGESRLRLINPFQTKNRPCDYHVITLALNFALCSLFIKLEAPFSLAWDSHLFPIAFINLSLSLTPTSHTCALSHSVISHFVRMRFSAIRIRVDMQNLTFVALPSRQNVLVALHVMIIYYVQTESHTCG